MNTERKCFALWIRFGSIGDDTFCPSYRVDLAQNQDMATVSISFQLTSGISIPAARAIRIVF